MGALIALHDRAGPPSRSVARRMLDAAPHRGTARRLAEHGRCLLGVSWDEEVPDAHLASDGTLSVAFNGALDNAPELAKALADEGGTPSIEDPAALVLEGWRALGPGLPARMRGVFAVAVTDGASLWCFRDHLGFRSLFYREEAAGFVLATEAKQVVAGAGISPEPDLDALEAIFYGSYDDETPSALRGVRRLRKSTLLRVDGHGGTEGRTYWDPEPLLETDRSTDAERRERFEDLMRQAASRVLTGSDVVSLSGGIDSPAVAAFAAPEHLLLTGRPLPALSTVYPDLPSVDESAYVELVAERLGLPLHTYRRTARPLERLDEQVKLLDGPVPHILVSDAEEHYRYARSLGFRTMLTGEMAEFVFDQRRNLLAHLLRRGRLSALSAHVAAQRAKGVGVGAIARQLAPAVVPRWVEARYRSASSIRAGEIPSWLDPRSVVGAQARYASRASRRWAHQQLAAFDGPGLTSEADEIVQAVTGLRVRRPWADVDLWELFLSLPAETKFPNAVRKGLVRRWLRGWVPDEILDREDKTVFNASIIARIDYDALRRWLLNPPHRIRGVRYDVLADRLRAANMDLREYHWAKDLAAVHAFLSLW
jgi:asparagine synthase (glutamine-hydrolysing)